MQELNTKLIFLCLYKLKIDKNYELDNKFLNCNEETYGDIIEEAFKRGIKPFFIPVIVLISSLVILYNKDNFFTQSFNIYYFLLF